MDLRCQTVKEEKRLPFEAQGEPHSELRPAVFRCQAERLFRYVKVHGSVRGPVFRAIDGLHHQTVGAGF